RPQIATASLILPSRSILSAAAAPRDGGAACSRWSEWLRPVNMASDPGRRRQSVAASIRRCAAGDDAERNFSAFTIGRLPAFPHLELVILVTPMERAVVWPPEMQILVLAAAPSR
ncbi:unnamed protein product, partial [Urochloa humidicola]